MSTRFSFCSCALALAMAGAGCSDAPVSAPWSPDADAEGHSAPTAATVSANAALVETLPLGGEMVGWGAGAGAGA